MSNNSFRPPQKKRSLKCDLVTQRRRCANFLLIALYASIMKTKSTNCIMPLSKSKFQHFNNNQNSFPASFCCSRSPFGPVFKPEELRQALMPTLEALYRQDPESLPFRQPVDPQLLGIPVRIRTSNKTNLVRDCTGCHFASTPLKM